MKTYIYTVTFTVPDEVRPDQIKDAVGAAMRWYQTKPDDAFVRLNRFILEGLHLNCEGTRT